MHDDHRFHPAHAERLNDPRRLEEHLSEDDLVRLLDLRGDEDVADLGSGTGFYTDIVARHTSGTVYAVEVSPEMNEAYRKRGVPPNVRLVEADVRELAPVTRQHRRGLLHRRRSTRRRAIWAWTASWTVCALPAGWWWSTGAWNRRHGKADHRPHRRVSNESALAVFEPYFETVTIEDLGSFMFALVARGRRATAP